MKIIPYKGVSSKAIALGVALYNKIKNSGKFGKKTIAQGLSLITAEYTEFKKRVLIVRIPFPFVFHRKFYLFSFTIDTTNYVISGFSGSDAGVTEETDTDTVVTAVNDVAIFTQSVAELDAVAGDYAYRSNLFYTAPGKSMNKEQRLDFTNRLVDTLIAEKRYEELFWIIGGGLRFSTKLYLSVESGLYTKGLRIGWLSNLYYHSFLGTDADGKRVLLCRINNPWVDGTEVVTSFPLWQFYYNDILQQTKNEKYSQAQYYPEHYAIVPLDVLIDYACDEHAEEYAFEGTGYNNSVGVPDLTIPYQIGDQFYEIEFTQAQMTAIDMSGDWQIVGTITAANIPPAQSDATYTLSGNGFNEASGVRLISDASFTVEVDDVGITGVYDTVYLPEHTTSPAWQFCKGDGDPALGNYDSILTGAQYNYSGSYSQAFTMVWFGTDTNIYGKEYALSTVGTSAGGASVIPISLSSAANTTSNILYNISYEAGQVVVTTVTPPVAASISSTTNGSYVNTGLEGSIGAELPGSINEVDTISASFTTPSTEVFTYDGIEQSYDAPYYKNGALSQTYTYYKDIFPNLWPGVPDEYSIISSSGLEQDRTSRSWYHSPVDATYDVYDRLCCRILVRKDDEVYPIHIHTVYSSGSPTKIAKVFVNGLELATTEDDNISFGAVSLYRHEMPSKFVTINNHYATYTLTCVICSGSFGDRTAKYVENASVDGYTQNGLYQMTPWVSTPQIAVGYLSAAQSYLPLYMYNNASLYSGTDDGTLHPLIEYDEFWLKNDDGYYSSATDASGQYDSHNGYTLFPVHHGASRKTTVIHWRGAAADTDGICVLQYSVEQADYLILLDAFLSATDDVDAARTAIDETITVVHNNFASPQMIRLFIPGECYTLFK